MSSTTDRSDATKRLVSLTLERTTKRRGQWEYVTWHIANVQDLRTATPDGIPLERGATLTPSRFIWSPLPIVLHEDAAEGYWYNLSGNVPSVFVVCTDDEESDGDLPPVTLVKVTLNHDEAAAHLETDYTVMSIAMPESLRDWLQQFVERHYRPHKRSKRKRADWSEDHNDAERPRAQRPVRGA